MSKTVRRARTLGPQVRIYTTRSGSRYVRSIDVIRSEAGRREIALQLKNQPKNGHAEKASKDEIEPASKVAS